MPISSRLVPRRTTLAAAPLLLAAGCRWGPAEESSSEPDEAVTPDVPDDEQVRAARDAIAEVDATVKVIAAQHPRLSKPLTRLRSMHEAHLTLLSRDGDEFSTATVTSKQSDKAALKRVRREEAALQATLAGLAADVSSGTLARTLAAMAAGVAQHRQLLPEAGKA